MDPFFRLAMYVKAGGPRRFLGLLVAIVGTGVVQDAARRADWSLVAIGIVVLALGATVFLRPRPFG